MFVAASVYVWWAFVPIWPILLIFFFFSFNGHSGFFFFFGYAGSLMLHLGFV